MEDSAPATGTTESLDSVVRKYASIWVWSILCATVAAQFVGSHSIALTLAGPWRLGTGNVFDAQQVVAFVASLLVLIAELVAMWYLYRFLGDCLLPLLFPGTDTAEPSAGPRALRGAFVAVLCGLAVQVAGCIIGFLFKVQFGIR